MKSTWRAIVPIIVTAIVLAACGPNPTPTPTPTPAPTPTPVNDDLARIRAAGRIRVGTSADYPPFAFYTPDFQLDGFDIELMRNLAQRIGVTADFQDYAFDGVLDALRLGQVDAAIAALSVDDERLAIVDFTNYYYIGRDGILARANASIPPITTVQAMAPYRIGVQRGTVYETWLRQSLVNAGLMPASNLISYPSADQVLAALRDQQVDIIVADLEPLNGVMARAPGQYRLVGQDLNVQRLAIAVRKGSNLAGVLNVALTQAQNDGTLSRLIEKWFQIPGGQVPTLPTPTPGVIVVVPTPVGCIDGMSYVADLNYNDNNMKNPPVLQPGQPFQKGWRVRNSGTCTWTTAYTFAFAGGNSPLAQMGGQPQAIGRPVQPGEVVDFYVSLVAPTVPGTYQGFWQMRNAQGRAFGTKVWVGITVPAPVAPTVPPPPPSTSIFFSATPLQVSPGQQVLFTWSVQNAVAVYFYPNGQAWQSSQVPPVAQQTVFPQVTTVYNLRVQRGDGSTELRQIQITVAGGGGGSAPVIQSFTLTPNNQITLGQCVIVAWNVQGSVSQVTLTRNNTTLTSSAPVAGSVQDCPQTTGANTYRLTAIGPGGTRTAERVLNVINPAGQGLRINSFFVTPDQIPSGSCVTVSWSVTGATFVTISRNNAAMPQAASTTMSGSFQDCIPTPGYYVYQLQASNQAGQTVTQQRAVSVFSPVYAATAQP